MTTTSSRRRTAILVSGRGSNMTALLAAAADPAFPARIDVVIANVPGAPALEKATAAGIEALAVDHRGPGGRKAFEERLDAELRARDIELICLAGFMRILTPWFVDRWKDRLINIHPALLPAFKGLDTHARALAEGCRIHGATVHFVRSEMDTGPVIAQGAVAVRQDDTPETLGARVLAVEHAIYPQALRLVASGAYEINDMRVCASEGESTTPAALIVPGG
ncbi:phosphoribosylglycinamide formyltransferase [Stappia sp. ES.058]|uniref:phosphoribosylglycinamide formyltransferase n=1 Tax=Stappia sp. ES.058 TaxID=1881061 RepID=UPI00087C484B|nr:phosphoribosylglycinamide formyltransferase [Stappia sp. ES.058]SDU13270.1 phosphoribosylglycinamide formyltransferase-1 [Stappia sp. ES.058]